MPCVTLSPDQAAMVLRALATTTTAQAHQSVWSRRSYAPGHIFAPEFATVRAALEATNPGYTIAFDVVFESRGGETPWHCDYESPGPFVVRNRWRAISDAHFRTVHFNLTPDGGQLVTLGWPVLSYVCYVVIAHWGIFSLFHTALLCFLRPVGRLWGTSHANTPHTGNVFDNTRLHMVTHGAPRTSYAVRLVRDHCVRVSPASVVRGIRRSAACTAFINLLAVVGEGETDVSAVDWAGLAPPASTPCTPLLLCPPTGKHAPPGA